MVVSYISSINPADPTKCGNLWNAKQPPRELPMLYCLACSHAIKCYEYIESASSLYLSCVRGLTRHDDSTVATKGQPQCCRRNIGTRISAQASVLSTRNKRQNMRCDDNPVVPFAVEVGSGPKILIPMSSTGFAAPERVAEAPCAVGNSDTGANVASHGIGESRPLAHLNIFITDIDITNNQLQ